MKGSPPVEGSPPVRDSPTVLVIGGGATGTGVAHDLVPGGVDVILAERNGLSSGASSRSHGLLHSGARYAEADHVGAKECITENRILRSIAGACIRDTGGLFVRLPEDDAAYFEKKRAACEKIGIDTRVLSGDEARQAMPRLSDRVEQTPGCGGRPHETCLHLRTQTFLI